MDGDAAAAYRYTEARMAAITEQVLADIDKETVNYVPNFDADTAEPVLASDNTQSFGQWIKRDRRWHGDQYAAAQPGRDRRCHCVS